MWKSWPAGVYDSRRARTARVFSSTNTHTHREPLLLTLNFILCCSCICCHHGDLVYDLTPLPKLTNSCTHYDGELGSLHLPLCLMWRYRTHRITAPPTSPGPYAQTHTRSSWPGWMQQAHAKHRAISSPPPNHLQAGVDNDIC